MMERKTVTPELFLQRATIGLNVSSFVGMITFGGLINQDDNDVEFIADTGDLIEQIYTAASDTSQLEFTPVLYAADTVEILDSILNNLASRVLVLMDKPDSPLFDFIQAIDSELPESLGIEQFNVESEVDFTEDDLFERKAKFMMLANSWNIAVFNCTTLEELEQCSMYRLMLEHIPDPSHVVETITKFIDEEDTTDNHAY
jgi:hypothetical protein